MIRRHAKTIAVLGACVAVLLAGVTWISVVAVNADRSRAAAQRTATFEENVRLTLWRMDSTVTPIVALESARPPSSYRAFTTAEVAGDPAAGQALVPSPLLAAPPEHVLLHFQVAPDGTFTSPQVPPPQLRVLAADRVSVGAMARAEHRLAELRARVGFDALALALPSPTAARAAIERHIESNAGRGAAFDADQVQLSKNNMEWQQRVNSVRVAQSSYQSTEGAEAAVADGLVAVAAQPMQPVWANGELLLVRRARVDGRDVLQGAWLDWTGLQRVLMESAQDLFVGSALVPRASADYAPGDAGRVLASLPLTFEPGALASPPSTGGSPIGVVLGTAWAGVIFAIGAVIALLAGTIALSERRATFVSAVTHELRTPLTSLRAYSEMLAGGMAPPAKRQHYLETMEREATRLAHLIDNVLAYSRVERGRDGPTVETLEVRPLLEHIADRVRDRADAAGVEVHLEPVDDALSLRGDPAAIERVVFNLVDNACKYAAADAPRVDIETRVQDRWVTIRVADNGPGIASDVELFAPFSKSAERAAGGAPGVGLGLALCRGLAREMGGELHHVRGAPGATFELRLRRA